MGILIYTFLAAGLGCWPRLSSRSGMSMTGLRLALGYAAMILVLYVVQAIAGVSGAASFWVLFALAAGGMFVRLRTVRWSGNILGFSLHPVWLLLLAGGAAVIANGGVDYLPVTNDEFSHWLGNPVKINAFGSWSAAGDSLHLADYPPGWPLLLALPWQVTGNVDFGAASTAPFVLHVATIGIVFDVVVFLIRKHLNTGSSKCVLGGWAFILLLLAAETLGPLWPTTLLIEPPQILGYTIVLLLLFASGVAKEDQRTLEFSTGTVLASCYLIKSAALLFAPAILGVFLLRLLLSTEDRNRLRNALISSARVILPVIIVAVSWGFISEDKSCLYSPLATLSPEALARAGGLDWQDLANRYTAALWEYTSSYKTPLTIAAMIGIIAALVRRNFVVPLALTLMGTAYLALLYWYHLTCFGDYYFEHLNSIERFTRVLLRTLHAVGLVLLLDAALHILARYTVGREASPRIPARLVTVGLLLGIVVLGAWQMSRVYRSVDIVTTRTGQSIDFRVDEMRKAAILIEKLKGTSLPDVPVFQIVSQGMDSAVVDYALFFALSHRRGNTGPRYKVARSHSWSPDPINTWQSRADREQVRTVLEEADIIWPTNLDPWLTNVLAELTDNECLRALPAKALIRVRSVPGKPRFACIDKGADR
jgi:hypothetical protein